MNRDYDVIVIGSGAAGLSAAVAAADAGAAVLVVEGDTQVGGSSRLSGGHFYAAGTPMQRAIGVKDDAHAMFEHYLTLNQWLVDPAVVRRYCDLSAPTLEWLTELGVRFPESGVYQSGVGSTPRGHQPEGAGQEVVTVLDGHRSHKGVDLVLNARVTDLLTDADGGVVGVRIGKDEATCSAVVMACGGFGANPEMLEKYYPQAAAQGDWQWYIGSDGAQGDGIRLGESVGAVVDGLNRGLLLVTPGFGRDLEVLLPSWLILVNGQGRRFASESAPYAVLGGLIEHQHGPVHAIFDEAARAAARPGPGSQANWVADSLAEKARDGRIHRADSLAELAAQIDVDAAGLQGTVARYNGDVAAGVDAAFFKQPMPFESHQLPPISTAPFYAAEVRPAIVCWTGAGVRINPDAAVLNRSERPIPGLFAAGETVGNLHGDRYVGGGGSFGPCIVFGKVAGEQAALRARSQNA